ncbi:MAG: ribonuclease III [Chakrabartia sp.]
MLSSFVAWITETFGVAPKDEALYARALTHGSHGADTYERLEFLGDRVLGLVVADWIYARFPQDSEGQLSPRFNNLVSGETCAEVGRAIGLAARLKLGKQAMDDGAYDSDNVLGDAVEALIGAVFLEHGLEAARRFIQSRWEPLLNVQRSARRHPKSELQEWAAAHNRRAPAYEVIERSGPHHAPLFRVRVSLGSAGMAEADGKSKQEAETRAAAALLEKVRK